MVAIRSQNATAFLAKPDPAIRAFLLFGPDAGMVSERARMLAQKLADRDNPPGEVIRLDDTDLDNDPDRISVELLTMPMFGGAKIVRTIAGRKVNAAMLKSLLEGAPLPGALIVEAGNLRPDEGARPLFEANASAAAIGCYQDEDASLGTLVSEILRTAKLGITPEAKEELVNRLGADRALSRAEIEKLALYAADAGTISIDHVEAIVGDASEMTIDLVIAAAASGDAAAALAECDRAVAAGESPQLIILMTERHFHRLHRTRAALDAGRSMEDALRQMRPPLPFKARSAFERQCRQWTTASLTSALARIASTAKAARLGSAIEQVHTERLLLELARLARMSSARK